jgi:hypothetical protein
MVCTKLITSEIRMPRFRRLAALEAIPEIIGRCVEMGRPLIFSIGRAALNLASAALAVAGFTILGETMRESIDKGAEVIVIANQAEHIPLLRGIMEESYLLAGIPEEMNPDNIIFIGGGQYAQIAATVGLMDKRNAAGLIFPGGAASADIVIYGEHAARIGAMSMAGMTNIYAWPWIVSTFDYSLLGEDVLAAGCILSGEPMMTSTIWSGDFYRFFLITIIIIALIATWVGIDVTGFFEP